MPRLLRVMNSLNEERRTPINGARLSSFSLKSSRS
ncbi:MAG: hypothetical protein ACI841_004476 [Planctomycetota bacterium]